MTTLKEIIEKYGSLTAPPAVGDRVIFARGDDVGGPSINLGEVTALTPAEEFKEATARVKGIRTFFPDGTNKRFRGMTPYVFLLNDFTKPIGERLAVHAEHLEKRAAKIRAWIATLDK